MVADVVFSALHNQYPVQAVGKSGRHRQVVLVSHCTSYVRHDDADALADLYTTSELLGHTDVKMTQVYAEIINRKKDEAVNLVNGLCD